MRIISPRPRKRFPKAKQFTDFRKLLDEMHKSIDAVTVSTPDHIHALAAAMAMRRGKHCFVQKPLTHSLHEARVLAQLARENKVATQMGNQGRRRQQSPPRGGLDPRRDAGPGQRSPYLDQSSHLAAGSRPARARAAARSN